MMIGMIISQTNFAQNYTIPYAMGIDTLQVKVGDEIKSPIVFYEEGDRFTREEAINGVVPVSSHEHYFFIDHPIFEEDTLEQIIMIIGGTFANDPRVLAQVDDRTGGDMEEPPDEIKKYTSDTDSGFGVLYSGITLLCLVIFARYKRWV